MKKNIHIIYILFATLFFYSCQDNDDVFLKALKQENSFLEEQLSFSKTALKAKADGNQSLLPYYSLFMKQDSVMRLFLKTKVKDNKEIVLKNYCAFIDQSNNFFNNAQNELSTKVFPDDLLYTQLKFDSLLLKFDSDSLRNELIKQQVLQRYLTIVQLYTGVSSICSIRFDNPNHFGFRLTIEKNDQHFLLNLKCFDPSRFPRFEKLEFISLSKNKKGDYYYNDDLSDIKFQIIEFKQENDAIIVKTKPLPTGFYRIYCNKLSISDQGRLIKQSAQFDFEITENQ